MNNKEIIKSFTIIAAIIAIIVVVFVVLKNTGLWDAYFHWLNHHPYTFIGLKVLGIVLAFILGVGSISHDK